METLVTSRIDSNLKDRVTGILKENGLTTSDAIRQMFEAVAINNAPDYFKARTTDRQQAKDKIARLDNIYVRGFENCTDEELRKMRIENRYATFSRL